MIEGEAFKKLRISITQLAGHKANTPSPKLDIAAHQDLIQAESPKAKKAFEHEEVQPVNLMRDKYGVPALDKNTLTEEMSGWSNLTPSLKESGEEFVSQSVIRESQSTTPISQVLGE